MEEKNIKKNLYRLRRVCVVIQNLCESHKDCEFCPFYLEGYDLCKISNAAEVNPKSLHHLMTSIIEDLGTSIIGDDG